ncbi:hypothetical protein MMC13_004525 [Lambiella insularis]|nr:hypothetical protein [Lambiella insularis]
MSYPVTQTFGHREERTHKRACTKARDLQDGGKPEEAVVLLRQNLDLSTRVLGADHLITINDQENLSDCLSELGEYKEAVSLDRKTLQARAKVDPKDPSTLATQDSLANNLAQLGNYDEAIELNRKTLASREAVLGKSHNDTVETRQNLAACLHGKGQDQEASRLNREVLLIRSTMLEPDDYDLIACRHNLAVNLHALDELDNALTLIRENTKALQPSTRSNDAQVKAVYELEAKVQRDIQKAADKKRAERQKAEEHKKAADERRTAAEKAKLIEKLKDEARIKELAEREATEKAKKVEAERKAKAKKKRENEEEESRKQAVSERHAKEEEAARQRQKEIEAQQQSDIPKSSHGPPAGHANVTNDIGNDTLSPPAPKVHKPRTKSNDNINRKSSPDSGLVVPTSRKARSKSVDPSSREQAEGSILTLFGSHDGDSNDTAAISAMNSWFGEFNSKTQALLAQGRKPMGRRVKIAILDTGIDLAHPDFGKIDSAHPEYGIPRDRVKQCKSFVNSKDGDRDTSGHGTHSAALLLKLAPKADVYVARVVGEESSYAYPKAVAEAIMHAADVWKVDIITMSFGWPRYHTCVEEAIYHASQKPVILCAAASNDGANKKVAFPASQPPVFCVHSASGWSKPSDFTPLPLKVGANFAVIGEAVSSTWPTHRREGSEKRKWGTSTASPILAAIVALILEFINQKPKKTSHDKRLKTPRAMMHVLLGMSEPDRGYDVVKPWLILDSQKDRVLAESRILSLLIDEFGPENESESTPT